MKKSNLEKSTPDSKKESFWLSFKGFVLYGAIILCIWMAYIGLNQKIFGSLNKAGTAGDSFGGLTALFSGLAFAGLIFTLLVQRRELELQRTELGLLVEAQDQTTEQLQSTAEQVRKQSDFIERQIFESNFFQMLRSFNSFLETIERMEGAGQRLRTVKGANALAVILRKFDSLESLPGRDFSSQYNIFYKTNIHDLGPFFRQIYQILKYVSDSNVDNKKFYSNILRAQMSSAELTLLAYNLQSKYGSEKMAPLMYEFDFLKHRNQ